MDEWSVSKQTETDQDPDYYFDSDNLEMDSLNISGFNITEYLMRLNSFLSSTTVPPLEDITSSNSSETQVEPAESCKEWESGQHKLFQASHFLFLCCFLIPKTFRRHILVSRTLLTTGFMILTIWSLLYVCSPDIVIWDVVLVLITGYGSVKYIKRLFPPHLKPAEIGLYKRMFKPYRVGPRRFKKFYDLGKQSYLDPSCKYAQEEASSIDERFSILLKGRLRVMCRNVVLYYIGSNQWIESIDAELNNDEHNNTGIYEVTIIADEPCLIISWDTESLATFVRTRHRFRHLLIMLLGKDVSNKLHSINERFGNMTGEDKRLSLTRTSEQCRTNLTRSLSVDAVHTGFAGHLRSESWRDVKRQESSQNRSNLVGYLDSIYETPTPATNVDSDTMVANQFPQQSPFSMSAFSELSESQTPRLPQFFDILEEKHLLLPRSKSVKNKKYSIRRHGIKGVTFQSKNLHQIHSPQNEYGPNLDNPNDPTFEFGNVVNEEFMVKEMQKEGQRGKRE